MKLHINSEVNPWPYGHKKLTQVNVLPHDPDSNMETYDIKNGESVIDSPFLFELIITCIDILPTVFGYFTGGIIY